MKTAIFIFMGFELFISLFFFKKRWKDSYYNCFFYYFLTYFIFSLYMTVLIILQITLKEFHSMQDRWEFSLHKTEMPYFDIFSRKQ